MSTVVTDARLDANDPRYMRLRDDQRDDICALLQRHGYDPNSVYAVAYGVIDCPLIGVSLYEFGDDGRLLHDDGQPLTRTEATALRGDLPEWWQPEADQ